MAHVKVTRRSMSTLEWIELRFGWLRRHIVAKEFEIPGWHVKEARQTGEMEYEFYDDQWRELATGDTYFTPDGTAFLTAEVTVPEELAGKGIWLRLKTSAEMIVKINGRYADGLDPNRDRILIDSFIPDDRHIRIEIEGYNRSKPDDDRAAGAKSRKGCRQKFMGAQLVILDETVLGAVYDAQILLDVIHGGAFHEDYIELVKTELDHALALVDFDEPDPEAYDRGVERMRERLASRVFSSDTYRGNGKAALVAHSHLDLAYFWRRCHSVQKNARTCLIQLRLMERYPEFQYAHSQAYTFEKLEQYYPELFEEVKQRVAEGRFEPVGGMYVEPDCNVTSPESLIRQCLYGQKFCRSRFGITVENCWLPDVFGNSWVMPQILRKAGMKYFVSNKMSTWNDTNRFPYNSFLWRGIDGSEIYASVPPTHFISWNDPTQVAENYEAYQNKAEVPETLCMFGYGDGGSGVTEEMLEELERFKGVSAMPQTRHVTAHQYLAEAFDGNESLEVYDGELYLEMHRGTFTTKGALKQNNRQCEQKLRDAELLASLGGGTYPAERLEELYKLLLVNQFHDILPGSNIAPVMRDAMADYDRLHRELDGLIAEHTGAGCGVINTLNWERSGVQMVAGAAGGMQNGMRLGKETAWFAGCRLPGIGIAPLPEQSEGTPDWFQFEDGWLETPHYRISFAPDGSIASLFDKSLCREWAAEGGLNKLRLYKDLPGNYDAWDILPNYKEYETGYDVSAPLVLKECGPVFVTLAVQYKTARSVWNQTIRVYREARYIDFEQEVDWQETNRLAKAEFNVNVLTRQAKCDTGAGTAIRETHRNTSWQKARFEVCQHKWTDLEEGGSGFALINDGKYGISLDGGQMGLSLLRSPVRPDPESDRGLHRFAYRILPHDGTAEEALIYREAIAFNTPLIYGAAEEEKTLLKLEDKNLYVQAVKRSEDGKSLVVRVTELGGGRGCASLRLPGKRVASAETLNLLEDSLGKPLNVEGDTVRFRYRPNEIITIGIKGV